MHIINREKENVVWVNHVDMADCQTSWDTLISSPQMVLVQEVANPNKRWRFGVSVGEIFCPDPMRTVCFDIWRWFGRSSSRCSYLLGSKCITRVVSGYSFQLNYQEFGTIKYGGISSDAPNVHHLFPNHFFAKSANYPKAYKCKHKHS